MTFVIHFDPPPARARARSCATRDPVACVGSISSQNSKSLVYIKTRKNNQYKHKGQGLPLVFFSISTLHRLRVSRTHNTHTSNRENTCPVCFPRPTQDYRYRGGLTLTRAWEVKPSRRLGYRLLVQYSAVSQGAVRSPGAARPRPLTVRLQEAALPLPLAKLQIVL